MGYTFGCSCAKRLAPKLTGRHGLSTRTRKNPLETNPAGLLVGTVNALQRMKYPVRIPQANLSTSPVRHSEVVQGLEPVEVAPYLPGVVQFAVIPYMAD